MRLRYDLPETSVIQLLLEVKACIFTVGEPTEVFFSLYCHEFQERITEEFKVKKNPIFNSQGGLHLSRNAKR
jgi:hypothetical protein